MIFLVPGRVAPGDYSPGAPTDPYVPFKASGSSHHEHATGRIEVCPSYTTCDRFVSCTRWWARCPRHVSLQRCHDMASPSLHGVPRMVPPLQRYYGTLRLPAVLLATFDCFTRRYHRFARGLLPSVVGVPPGARELSVPVSPSGISMETAGSPRFPGNPDGHCPCSSTPAGSGRLSGP